MAPRILLIEDDPDFRAMLVEALSGKGYAVTPAGSAEEGLRTLAQGRFDLVLTDVKLPGMTGLESVPKLKDVDPGVDIIVMTAYASREAAVEAVRNGAYDFFAKPFSLAEMEVVIRRALEKRRLQAEVSSLRRALGAEGGPLARLVGDSDPMRRIKALLEKIAPLETTVLITGESGTGKELVADTIHALSSRAAKPFVRINCAAIPDNLLESELFGHEKGAFTGALTSKPGLFEMAHGGSILLDEIGDMPLALQAKLLRVVEYKQVMRLGGGKTIDVDVRIMAATNQDLLERSREKLFREDLYYRLNVATVHLPPLRERRDDVPQLTACFLDKVNVRLGTAFRGVSGDGRRELMAAAWPGNVRQLANIIERAAILGQGDYLTGTDVAKAFQKSLHMAEPALSGAGEGAAAGEAVALGAVEAAGSLKETMRHVERNLIMDALQQAGGRQAAAARLLGISPKNLWNKLQKHGIGSAE
ncbi:MAG: sigma-54-dependent transcriptional regulator [Desulfovibrionaceae bacterium]